MIPVLDAASVIDESPDGILVLDPSGRVLRVNEAFLEMSGRSRSEVLHAALESLVAEEDLMCLLGFETVIGAHAVRDAHVIFTDTDGERCPLVVCSNLSSDGRYIVLTTRASGSVQRELADASRWAAAEGGRARALSVARDALAERNTALRAAQSELEQVCAKLQEELHARERLEHELRLAQKLEAVGQLAAGVAHEINTPMQYIGDNIVFLDQAFQRFMQYVTAADSMLASVDSDSIGPARSELAAVRKKLRLDYYGREAPKALSTSREGVKHVSEIVGALKGFAHVDRDDMVHGDINRTIQDTLVIAQNEYKRVAVIETALGELPLVNCFIGKLGQVFLNLIVNAAHAIDDSKRGSLGTISVTTRAGDGIVEVAVADNGCGVPQAIRDRIFEPFFTTKEVGRGTGQGLALARRIVVEVHGGTMTLEDAPGGGAKFVVRLPIDGRTKLSVPDAA